MAEAALPRWEMATIFPTLESMEYAQAVEAVVMEIKALTERFEALNVRRRDQNTVDAAFVTAFEEVTGRLNRLLERQRVLRAYARCFVTTDARNERAQAAESRLEMQAAQIRPLQTRFTAWIGSSDAETLLRESAIARDHEWAVRKAQTQARHQMSEAEESLAAELNAASAGAWDRLHGNLSALLTADVPLNDETKTLPMSAVRALANNPDRATRQAAFEAELDAWKSVATPFAAALNGVKGYQRTLRVRRGYEDDLAPTLLVNNMDRATLDAMHQACVEAFPDLRRYMSAKARALGLERLAWHDLNAPVATATRDYSWVEAETFIRENFARYSQRLADFADQTFRERWIDAEPRVGKEGGAYCAGIGPGVSRVMLNFDGSFASISTLAHELGHAYHNLNLKPRTYLQRVTPMTLAETASIFCETLSFDAALARADRNERLALLDTMLERDLMVVVDIHSRFLFEQAVFEKRAERDLSVAELNALMTDAQRQTYGADLDPLHPYMWAVKGHYYSSGFYNYPYTFGLLFGLGLYAYYQQYPDGFHDKYDDFLSSTGLADAKTLAQRFGVDIAQIDFWRSSLDVIREHISEFERLIA